MSSGSIYIGFVAAQNTIRQAGGQERKQENKTGLNEEIKQVFEKTVCQEVEKLKQMKMPEGSAFKGLDPRDLKPTSRPDSNGSNAKEDSVGSVSKTFSKLDNEDRSFNDDVFDSVGNDRL